MKVNEKGVATNFRGRHHKYIHLQGKNAIGYYEKVTKPSGYEYLRETERETSTQLQKYATVRAKDIPKIEEANPDMYFRLDKAGPNRGYAMFSKGDGSGGRRDVYLHHIIKPPKKQGHVTHHLNEDKLYNDKRNLRSVTQGENSAARSHFKNSTGERGAYQNPNTGKYEVRIQLDGVNRYLGTVNTKEEAAKRYNDAYLEHYGREPSQRAEWLD
jgi:hypothetical protein